MSVCKHEHVPVHVCKQVKKKKNAPKTQLLLGFFIQSLLLL